MLLLPLYASLLTAPTPAPSAPPLVEVAWAATMPSFARLDSTDHAERRTYLRLNGGLVTTESSSGPDEDIDFDEGYLLAVSIGQRFGASDTGLGIGVELEGLWTDQDADDQGPLQAVSDVTVGAVLVNGMLDFRLADQISLYGGAGVGVAWVDVGTRSDSINDFSADDGPSLAWQAKAGVAWHVSDNTAVSLGYRFLNIDDSEIDDGIGSSSFDLETQQHVLEVGLIFGI